MPEDDPAILDQWLTLPQAALAYHLSERTLRRRIALPPGDPDHLPSGKQGVQIRVKPPRGYVPPAPAPTEAQDAPPTAIELVSEQFGQMIAAMRQDQETLRDELAAERAARLADKEEMGRLRGRLEAAEAELERARQLSPTTPPEAPRRRWWQR